jgi:hypothetical protein
VGGHFSLKLQSEHKEIIEGQIYFGVSYYQSIIRNDLAATNGLVHHFFGQLNLSYGHGRGVSETS